MPPTPNPDGLSNQLEGGFVQAASWTLYEAVAFANAMYDATGVRVRELPVTAVLKQR